MAPRLIDDAAYLELIMEPELSIVLFRRTGGAPRTTRRGATGCSTTALAFVTPTSWAGEMVLRICIVNPLTSVDDLA